ncbi:hypothetical protein SK128_002002 [Halocaridina rubra]|uniref:Failed axon connections-like protein n=1 Tax=Halocaridina rubra TaxID=373956 RepID=A0AAN8XD64_HALRR
MPLLAAVGITPMRVAGKGAHWLWGKCKPAVVTAIVLVGALKLTSYIQRQNRRKKWNNAGKDVVVLHSFPRGKFCPNLSPFVVKLETYLRMAAIPYELDTVEPIGPKGKCPWITLNGEEIADSQLIMEKLSKLYGKNFSTHLSEEQKALALSMRIMIEEHFLWCLILWRYIIDEGRSFFNGMIVPKVFHVVFFLLKRYLKKACHMQGIGRHSYEEIEEMGRKDLAALSSWLGDKPFFMGEKPTEVDCAIFGMLSQIQWNSAGSPYLHMLESDFVNLSAYCLRVKEKFWPDWNKCLYPPVE